MTAGLNRRHMKPKSPHPGPRPDRKQMPLAFDEAKNAVALPLEAQLQATRLFGQLFLAVAKNRTSYPNDEYRKNNSVA
jgi:hypothetical protein